MPALSRTEARTVVQAALKLGIDLEYFRRPEPEIVTWILRRCLDEALAGAAVTQSSSERREWHRAAVRCRLALDSGRAN